jgi:tellurite methyltransferase
VARDVRGAEAEHRSRAETGDADDDGGEKRLSQQPIMAPSPFVVEWIARLAMSASDLPARRRALDVAMGRGRHAIPLARAGFTTFGVDIKFDAVREAAMLASSEGLRVCAWCADLTEHPLPRDRFALVVVTRYLQRDLFRAIQHAVIPGGVVLYETFTVAQRALGFGPTSPDHLLESGELRGRFDGFEILFDEEMDRPEAVARIVARRPDVTLA